MAPQIPLADLAEALRSEQAVVLTAYVDESERLHRAGRSFFMGGWLGESETWAAYEPQWQLLLKEAGVSEFHSSDFANREGEFVGWLDEKADNLLAGLLSVIRESKIYGLTTMLDLDVPEDR